MGLGVKIPEFLDIKPAQRCQTIFVMIEKDFLTNYNGPTVWNMDLDPAAWSTPAQLQFLFVGSFCSSAPTAR